MNRTRITVSLAAALVLTACKRDDYVQESIDLLDKHAKEVRAKIEGASDKQAGVADARKYLDANKADITARMQEIGKLRGFQVSEDMRTKLGTAVVGAAFMCSKLQTDLMMETTQDQQLDTALDALCESWDAAVAT